MANLWRVLALVWLGGIASPVLLDDPAVVEAVHTKEAATQTDPSGLAIDNLGDGTVDAHYDDQEGLAPENE